MDEWCVPNVENRLKPPLQLLVSECCWHLYKVLKYLLTHLFIASTRFVVCDSCHHFFQVLMDVDVSQMANSVGEAEEHLLSSLPSPKQVTTHLLY